MVDSTGSSPAAITKGHRLLRADAGTGKTYSLTLHYLSLLAAGVPAERILGTTFTRKAAGEILERILLRLAGSVLEPEARDRLREELAERGAEAVSPEQAVAWLEQLRDQLPRLAIGTLDSFFRRLVSSFRYELGLVRLQEIVAPDDPRVEDLRARALGDTLLRLARRDQGGGSAGALEALVELTARLYRGQAQRSVSWAVDRILLELHELIREAPDRSTWSALAEPAGRLDADSLRAAINLWMEQARRAGEPLPAATDEIDAGPFIDRWGARIGKALATDAGHMLQGDWKTLISNGIAKGIDEALIDGASSFSYYKKPFPGELFVAYAPIVQHARAACMGELRAQTVATWELLKAFRDRFETLRWREGLVLYSDLADLVAHGLGALDLELQLAIAYRLDGRVEHVLLDEFQDTSIVQWAGLRHLVDEILAWGDGTRSLFVVGDPKQSIYGWRGGRPELFDLVDHRLEPLVAEGAAAVTSLNRSYRSAQTILDAVNLVFDGLDSAPAFQADRSPDADARRSAAKDWSRSFEEHRSALDGDDGYVVLRTSECWEGTFDESPFEDGEDAPDDLAMEQHPLGHLDFVARCVLAIHERRPSAGIGVLVRTNRTVSEVLRALGNLGLRASGEGRGPVVDDGAVTSVCSALRLAAYPADSTSLVHLAGTPLGRGFGLAPELAWRPQAPEQLVRAAAELSRRLRLEIEDRGAVETVCTWLRRLEVDLPARTRARLQQTVEEMLRLRPSLDRDPAALVRWLAQATVEEPSPGRVRVMTIHQAKGLEFDVVVLGELETAIGRLMNPLVNVLRETPLSPPSAVYRATNRNIRAGDPGLRMAHRQEIERQVRDDLGGLYVAMTRARQELHLVVQPCDVSSKGKILSGGLTHASIVRGALAADAGDRVAQGDAVLAEFGALARDNAVSDDSTGPDGDSSAESLHGSATSRSANGLQITRSVTQRSTVAPSRSEERTSSLLRSNPTAVRRGRLLHAYLSRIEWLRRRGPAASESALRAAEREVFGSHAGEMAERIRREFQSLIERPAIRRVFERPDTDARVWREQRFAVALPGGPPLVGVFDRVVLLGGEGGIPDAVDVIDFKAGVREPGRVAEVAAQMKAYREAAAALTGVLPTAVRSRGVWLDLGEVHED